jgi:hypothetical protein
MTPEWQKPLEDELRSLLRRKEPPAGFTERVLSKVQTAPARRAAWRERLLSVFASPRLRWAAGGALACIVLAVGGVRYRQYRRAKVEGEIAKEQVMVALRIASAKLNVALKQVREVERPSSQSRRKAKRAS